MTYRPATDYLWDFWFAPKVAGEPFRLFHLAAPRTLPGPEERHWNASIAQAESDDLITWRPTGTAISRGPAGSWDDRTIWTGCTIFHGGTYYLYYTALSTTDRGPVQRIGVATSTDLTTWTRHLGNPVFTADSRWYQTAETNENHDEPLRDPFVFFNEEHACWFMVYCAKANHGPSDARGVVGLARSSDLLTWEPLPPLYESGEFGQLEVPQIVRIGSRWYLVFCTFDHSQSRLDRTGPSGKWYGTHYLVADDQLGPYRLIDEGPLAGGLTGTSYAGRIETELTGEPLYFAWRRLNDQGEFEGFLSNPVSVSVDESGGLSIDESALWG